MPVPMINVLNGGAHADNPLDFQEFMVLPVGATSFAEAVRMGAEVFHALKDALKRAGHSVNVGDEGGFAPDLRAAEEALDFLMAAIGQAGLRPGQDVALGLDPAASEFHRPAGYVYAGQDRRLSAEEQVDYLAALTRAYPILSIEDGMAEDDPAGWKMLTERGRQLPAGRRRCVLHQSAPVRAGHRAGPGQCHPGQAQPDRHADGDAAGAAPGRPQRLSGGHVAPFRRDRGHQHRGPGGGWPLRRDQDRFDVALGSHGQIQSPAQNRARTRGRGGIRKRLAAGEGLPPPPAC